MEVTNRLVETELILSIYFEAIAEKSQLYLNVIIL